MFNLAIMGLGAWGKRLVNAVQGKSETVRFKTAVTRTPSKVEAFADGHGIALGSDYQLALGDPEIDAVVVCSHALLHVEHTMAAIEAGKHVHVVKPLAQTTADAEAVYGAAERKGVFVAMGYERCFLPAADELRRRVGGGDLGKIIHVEGNYCVGRYFGMKKGDWKTDAAVAPPGAFADHMLYMMIELIGPVEEVYARGYHQATDFDVFDTSSVMMRFASGPSGLLTGTGVTADYIRLQFFGTDGWAEMRGASHFEFAPRQGEGTVTDFPAFDALKAQLETFAAAAQGKTDYPMPARKAIDAVAALEAMARSSEENRPVTL